MPPLTAPVQIPLKAGQAAARAAAALLTRARAQGLAR
jgi:hypothetical protein